MREHKQITPWVRNFANRLRAVSFIFRLSLIAVAISLAASTPVPAQNVTRTVIIQGGTGGNYFEYICGSGRFLTGLQGSAGVLIDSVQAVCGRIEAGRLVETAQPEGPVFGGSRPIDKSAGCATGITEARIAKNRYDPLIGAIAFQCPAARPGQSIEIRGSGHLEGEYKEATIDTGALVTSANAIYKSASCPARTVAVGIRGRAGRHLDAFGLVCGPAPGRPIGKAKLIDQRASKSTAVTTKKDGGPDTVSLPKNSREPDRPTEPSRPLPTPGPSGTGSNPVASTDIKNPTPLTSNELAGKIREGIPPNFYSFIAGPGEVVFTLDVNGAEPGGGAGYFYLIRPDAPDDFLVAFDLFAGSGSSENLVKRVEFAEQQTIILRVGGHVGGGSYRLRISGAVTF